MAKKKKSGSGGWKFHVLSAAGLMLGIVYSAVAIVFVVGMIPTLVAAIVDKTKSKTKAMTVGAMNFAGCMPFMVEVWKKGGSLDTAITYILEPRTIVVIYFAAMMGYLIEWAVTGIVSSVMVQRGKARMIAIREHQKELTERWGPEVTGNIPLDHYGFPIEVAPNVKES